MHHSFDIDLACLYGVPEAILINHTEHWIAKNRANGVNVFDGDVWTYNSVKAYGRLFPYYSERQIRNALDHLIQLGVLKVGYYSEDGRDRTRWFAFTDLGKCILQKCQMQLSEKSNEYLRYIDRNGSTTSTYTGTGEDEEDNNNIYINGAGARAREAAMSHKAAVAEMWHGRFGKPATPAQIDTLCWDCEKHGEWMVREAIEQAAYINAASPMAYIHKLLSDWRSMQIHTEDDLDEYQDDPGGWYDRLRRRLDGKAAKA